MFLEEISSKHYWYEALFYMIYK